MSPKKAEAPVKKTRESELAAIIFKRTQEWADKNGLGVLKDKAKYSDKAKKYDAIISRWNFGCQEGGVREIVEELLGEKLPPAKKKDAALVYEVGIAVVPMSDPNGHSYETGAPHLVITQSGVCLPSTGVKGSKSLPTNSKTAVRPANLEEIEWLMEQLLGVDEFKTMALGFLLDNFGK